MALVVPGDVIDDVSEKLVLGEGVYVAKETSDGQLKLKASLVGQVVYETIAEDPSKRLIRVSTAPLRVDAGSGISGRAGAHDVGRHQGAKLARSIRVSDICLCRVTRIFQNQVAVLILAVDSKELLEPAMGVIKRQDVQDKETDALQLHECFRPGDSVRAFVVSMGDTKQFYLSTSGDEYGVIVAKSRKTGKRMKPVSLTEMTEEEGTWKERRKVASVV